MKVLYLSAIVAVLCGCCSDYCPLKKIPLEVYNYSNMDINTLLVWGESRSHYPDTLLPSLDMSDVLNRIKPLERDYWEYFKFDGIDTLCLFILSPDTIAQYGWDKVREDYNILARYDLCVMPSELRKLGFEVSYPPTEDMKDVKMYPSYGYLTSTIQNVSGE